ncbi:MAG: [protein-PII] uridylyltransferase [Deltaproteobacteria bacterium]|jgi:[protein-PII] uridylyltransferase|nr:[protein-PII] uridylyltransferase [Deltaproteobacteria bacterium]
MISAFEELKKSRRQLLSMLPTCRTIGNFQTHHTANMDQYFRASLQESQTGHRLFSKRTPFAFLAVGGYGRGELSLHSDIDVLILFGQKIPGSAKGLTEEIFYPLWDLGLDLGYGTRTIKDCVKLSRDDFEVLTAMMDARFLCGDSLLFLDLMESLQKKVTSKRKIVFRRWLENLYQIRMDIKGDASIVLEPDLKDGIGGLRDYHYILWLAKAFFNLVEPRDLEYTGKLSHNEYKALKDRLDFIWLVRNHLHQLSGRRNDRLTFEYQEKIALRLGYRDCKDLLAVEQFMGDLHASMAAVKALNRTFIKTHLPKGRGPWKSAEALDVFKGFHTYQGEIGFDSATVILSDPLMLMTVFEQGSQTGYPLSMEARRLVSEFLPFVDDNFRRSKQTAGDFLKIINGNHTFDVLIQMQEIGFLSSFVPEFGKIENRVQFDAYHTFPVGRHSLETIRRLKAIHTQKEMLLLDIFLELPDPEPLFLAALFHDIGKVGPKHAARGAEIAREILERMHYPGEATEDVLFLIKHHLLLVETATRRDLSDEKSVVQCARIVGNLDKLRMLYLLTWADSMATGPGAWNDWIANLVQELFFKVLNILVRGELATVDASQKVQQTMDQTRQKMFVQNEGIDPDPFFEVMSPRYLLNRTPRDIVHHIGMARSMSEALRKDAGNAFSFEARENPAEDCYEITVLTKDRPGLFADMAGVLALNSVNILSADIYTWRDGTAVDIFKATKPLDPIDPDRIWQKVRSDLKGTFEGKLSLAGLLGQKGTSSVLSNHEKPSRPPQIVMDNRASDFFTLIEVFADDRAGFLYLITKTLFDLRLDIRIAKIATKGDQIADVFYVRDIVGQKIKDEAHLKEIEGALRYQLIQE